MPPAVSDSPQFDVREIPFSIRGSWLDLSPVVGLHTHRDDIHLVSHQTGIHGVLALVPYLDGARVDTRLSATPSVLRWRHPHGRIEATFDGVDAVRLRGTDLGLRLEDAAGGLTPFTGSYLFVEPGTDSAVFTSYESGRRERSASSATGGRSSSKRSPRPDCRIGRHARSTWSSPRTRPRSARTSTRSHPGGRR
jgi:hypothetical protein